MIASKYRVFYEVTKAGTVLATINTAYFVILVTIIGLTTIFKWFDIQLFTRMVVIIVLILSVVPIWIFIK